MTDTAPHSSNARRRATRIAHRLTRAARFIDGADVAGTPQALRGDCRLAAWQALTADERLAHLTAHVEADEVARDTAKREARRSRFLEAREADAVPTLEAPAASVPAPSHTRPTRPTSPYLVGCADGCGEFVPAPSPRPTMRYLEGHSPTEVAATRARAARLARAERFAR